MLLWFAFVLPFICAGQQTSGSHFISYHVYGEPTSSSCYPLENPSKWAGYITANIFGLPCGTCVQMVAGTKTIYAYAIDIGGRGFDLNLPAFCELCGQEGGFAAGGCNVNWKVVPDADCTNWIAGKKKPACELCPAGSICGNPDPNRNGGVPWDTYCPSLIPELNMRRCEMRLDGCTCYGATNPPPTNPPPSNPPPSNPPPTKPPPSNPPPTKTPASNPPPSNPPPSNPPPTSKGKTSTRCGLTWGDADTKCGADCLYPEQCPKGNNCFASLSMAPCASLAVAESSTQPLASSQVDVGMITGIVCGIVGLALVLAISVFFLRSHPTQERV